MTVVENESGAKQCTLEPAQRMTGDNSTGLDNKHTFVTFIHFHSECVIRQQLWHCFWRFQRGVGRSTMCMQVLGTLENNAGHTVFFLTVIIRQEWLTLIVLHSSFCPTYSMEDSPSSEARKISRISRNPVIHQRVHKSLSLVPILSRIHPVLIRPVPLHVMKAYRRQEVYTSTHS